jgi:hypothetical protein
MSLGGQAHATIGDYGVDDIRAMRKMALVYQSKPASKQRVSESPSEPAVSVPTTIPRLSTHPFACSIANPSPDLPTTLLAPPMR